MEEMIALPNYFHLLDSTVFYRTRRCTAIVIGFKDPEIMKKMHRRHWVRQSKLSTEIEKRRDQLCFTVLSFTSNEVLFDRTSPTYVVSTYYSNHMNIDSFIGNISLTFSIYPHLSPSSTISSSTTYSLLRDAFSPSGRHSTSSNWSRESEPPLSVVYQSYWLQEGSILTQYCLNPPFRSRSDVVSLRSIHIFSSWALSCSPSLSVRLVKINDHDDITKWYS